MKDDMNNESQFANLPPLQSEEDLIVDSEVSDLPPVQQKRSLPQMMRKIPVTLTLEVGAAKVSLQDLVAMDADSVLELDTLAGEPLILKANGTPIGRAEVVLSGENYGLRVVEMTGFDLESLGR